MEMNLYNISIIAGLTGITLLACYLIMKVVIRNELKNSLPNQIKTAQDYFKNKNVRLTIRIKPNGETEWENFDIIKEPSYVG